MQSLSRSRLAWLGGRAYPSSGLSIWAALLVLAVFLAFASPHFLTVYNISNVLLQASLTGALALGLTPIIIAGKIDLTVGSLAGLAACLVVSLNGLGVGQAILITLLVGAGLGAFNGILVAKLGIDSFIVTLGGMIGIRGITFLAIGDASLSPDDTALMDLIDQTVGPVSLIVILFLIAAAGFHFMLTQTGLGRNAYAIGGNEKAAHDAGVRIKRSVVALFALSGLMAALGGIMTAARLNSATPAIGTNYELWAIISVALGGTRLRGGAGSIVNTLGAILLLAALQNGLNLLNVSPFYIPVILGACLIAALIIDRRGGRASEV